LPASAVYTFIDVPDHKGIQRIYYRVKLVNKNGSTAKYSNIISIVFTTNEKGKLTVFPNPVKDILEIQLYSKSATKVKIEIFESSGRLIHSSATTVQKGNNVITMDELANQPRGLYFVQVYINDEIFREKILLTRK
jgi:hypothetical protein